LSLQVAKIRGIPIRLHFTLIIVFFLIVWTLASRLMPEIYPGLDITAYWIMGIMGAIVLFISILLHELAHSIIALRYGLKVRQIMLFIFGGVSDIDDEEISKDFRKEFKIAVAGPITSFTIAGILAALLWLLISSTAIGSESSVKDRNTIIVIIAGVLYYGALANMLLGGFNLIPAFPLDGGRMLRSALLRWKRDYDKSTKIAAKIGIGISFGFMGFGFFTMFAGSFIGGIWLVLIGWFLNSGAQSYLAQYELTSILSGVRLSSIMNSRITAVREDMTIDRLIRDFFNVHAKDSFPIIDDSNRLVGMVTFKDAWRVPEHRRESVHTTDIMISKSNLIIIQENGTADDALKQMARKRMSRVFICDEQGRLLGLVSKTDIMNAASERKEYVKAVRKLADQST
jgi:Zn-dependent protease/predicted transcriptional regulator